MDKRVFVEFTLAQVLLFVVAISSSNGESHLQSRPGPPYPDDATPPTINVLLPNIPMMGNNLLKSLYKSLSGGGGNKFPEAAEETPQQRRPSFMDSLFQKTQNPSFTKQLKSLSLTQKPQFNIPHPQQNPSSFNIPFYQNKQPESPPSFSNQLLQQPQISPSFVAPLYQKPQQQQQNPSFITPLYQRTQDIPQHNIKVETAHVYFPKSNTGSVQRPMQNVVVKYLPANSHQHKVYRQPQHQIAQYSEPRPAFVQQIVQVQQIPQQHIVQVQQIPQQHIVQVQQNPQNPLLQSIQSLVQNIPLHGQQDMIVEESKNRRFPKNKSRNPRRPSYKHKIKSYYLYKLKAKPSYKVSQGAYPVFTTIGKGLDGLNAVRRGVKKGTGFVVARGVKGAGKLASVGAGLAAKAIKLASSI